MLTRQSAPGMALLLVLMTVPAVVSGQPTADEILKNVVDTYERQVSAVDDFTVFYTTEGDMQLFESAIIYHEKVQQDGLSSFRVQSKMEGGLADLTGDLPDEHDPDPLAINRKLVTLFADVAEYRGTETVDGHTTHVLFVEDATPLMSELGMAMDIEDLMDTKLRNAVFHVDADEWVMRKMTVEMEMSDLGSAMKTTTLLQDYRQVGPMLYPHRMTNVTDSPISDEEREELEEAMKEARDFLDKLPKDQPVTAGSIQGAFGDQVEMVMVVEELRVNAGVPDELR